MQALDLLATDIREHGLDVESIDWDDLRSRLELVSVRRKTTLFDQDNTYDQVLFLTQGVVAVETFLDNGKAPIFRFFERTQFCLNIGKLCQGISTSDRLFAVTDVSGLLMPYSWFIHQYLGGDVFGQYLRVKILEVVVIEKEIATLKTLSCPEESYRFLEERFPEATERALNKYIASYLGLTPEGFCRFLKKRRDAVRPEKGTVFSGRQHVKLPSGL